MTQQMQRAEVSVSPDDILIADMMPRMASDDIAAADEHQQRFLTPFFNSSVAEALKRSSSTVPPPTTALFVHPSREESPISRPASALLRHVALVTPIVQLSLDFAAAAAGSAACFTNGEMPTPEKGSRPAPAPLRKPLATTKHQQSTHAPKVCRPVQDFVAFAKALPECVEKGEYRLELTPDGAGGTYFVKARASDMTVAVFKPSIQEIGEVENPRGNVQQDERFDLAFRAGDGYKRERLAYLLDHGRFAGVPETCVTEVHGEIGSLQRFVPSMMQSWSTTPAKFDVCSVQRIAVFDIRTLNADRHGGNLLVRRDAPSMCVVPIDHGYILPEGWCDPDFEWAMWPQSAAPVSDDVRDYVARLDAAADAALVAAELGDACGEVIAVTTKLLQVALKRGKTYTLRDVAAFCRRGAASAALPCGLEALITASRRDLDEGGDLDMDAVVSRLESAFP